MMAAAKRTDNFFKKVPVGSNAAADAELGGADSAAAAAGGQQLFEYMLHSKEEFEALNKCQVGWCSSTKSTVEGILSALQ
jgi:hypothetical protein